MRLINLYFWYRSKLLFLGSVMNWVHGAGQFPYLPDLVADFGQDVYCDFTTLDQFSWALPRLHHEGWVISFLTNLVPDCILLVCTLYNSGQYSVLSFSSVSHFLNSYLVWWTLFFPHTWQSVYNFSMPCWFCLSSFFIQFHYAVMISSLVFLSLYSSLST